MREQIAALTATIKRTDDIILTLTDDNEKQAERIAALTATLAELKQALRIAALAIEIASDWGVPNVQVYPPKEWGLYAFGEDVNDGWCSTAHLAEKLEELSRGKDALSERDKEIEMLRVMLRKLYDVRHEPDKMLCIVERYQTALKEGIHE